MRWQKVFFGMMCILCSVSQIWGTPTTRPFPQEINFPGCIKPNNVSQSALNNEIKRLYDSYKSQYRRNTGEYYYTYQTGTGEAKNAQTVSEAHGYGMIITVLMAGYDPDAKEVFDGMNALRKKHPSSINPDLMAWMLNRPGTPEKNSAATDGDFDNAYALLLAYDQWGNEAYLNEAKTIITAIKQSEMSTRTYRTQLGDWDTDTYTSRSSDWMTGHMRAFATATNDNFWLQAADTVYSLVDQVSNDQTGLVPDFIKDSPAIPDWDGGGTAGEHSQAHYSYNACRFPWRIATDYAHYGTADAKQTVDKISTWLRSKTNNNPVDINPGYELNGKALSAGDYFPLAFAGPFAAGMTTNSDNQSYLNSLWTEIANNTKSEGAYNDALRLLSMLLISGNWWAPGSSDAIGKYSLTISDGSGSGFYPEGETVSINAKSFAGREFTSWGGDIAGLNLPNTPSAQFIMPAKTINLEALYTITDSSKVNDLVYFTDWEEHIDSYGSTTSNSQSAGELTIEMTRVDSWSGSTWAKLLASVNADFSSFESITLTYTATAPFNIALEDDAFKEGEAHRYELPASSTARTITLLPSQFVQPSWGTQRAINLNTVNGVSVSATNIGYSEIKISEFLLNGITFEPESPIAPESQKPATSTMNFRVSAGKIHLNVPAHMSPNLMVRLYDLRGRLLSEQRLSHSAGIATVNVPAYLARNQTAILSVVDEAGTSRYAKQLILH